jgi:hypothetical protein
MPQTHIKTLATVGPVEKTQVIWTDGRNWGQQVKVYEKPGLGLNVIGELLVAMLSKFFILEIIEVQKEH